MSDSMKRVVAAAQSVAPVAGLTHGFYRYPARFSPEFARAAIEAFSERGDWVFDPFMGGGTSAVEALAAGRHVAGCDLNQLSRFLVLAKTTPLPATSERRVVQWSKSLSAKVRVHGRALAADGWQKYRRNLPWWLARTIDGVLATVEGLPTRTERRFARCATLRTAQWALDCKERLPGKEEFLQRLDTYCAEMLQGLAEFTAAHVDAFDGVRPRRTAVRRMLIRSAVGIDEDKRLPFEGSPPKLILTSPPYLGVHILYHRWQVKARRETPAPYWVAECHDGRPSTYYNFASRHDREGERYMASARAAFGSVVNVMGPKTTMVQLVAFSRPEVHLPAYRAMLGELGLEEVPLEHGQSVIGRQVPNRKWYADVKGEIGASREFLLVHRLAR